ncbi:NACHT domain-containing protein [Amycolatopsis alba]|uniref:NACHT domain-containing protein n=1 Tax=Amycolatopsis alba TaxID=76020 RepID=UPI00117823F5|nr:hypothetical protein [Amycolatopsis alba]
MHNEITNSQIHGSAYQIGNAENVHITAPPEPRIHPPLESWEARSELTPALRDLLDAQREATESLPYELLGVKQPELTKVYVRQHVRPQVVERQSDKDADRKAVEERTPRAVSENRERPITVTKALDRGGHLVITGEPGAGKSTLGHMYVQRISELWLAGDGTRPPLSEPVLAIRVPARALATGGSWSERMADGVQEACEYRLASKPKAELFAQRALGARWLVFIDGLDEIAEIDTRRKVIKAIAYQMRRSADHRLVVTTRPLPDAELQDLEQPGVDLYSIQPFGPDELSRFADAWFRAQDPISAHDRATEFIRQVHDGRLRELVRNPLLATIAAIADTLEPERKLPNNRAGLYKRFMEYLLDGNARWRKTIADLRRSQNVSVARLRLVEWTDEHRVTIIEHLAVQRMETDGRLFEAACAWVAEEYKDAACPDGWRDDLWELLAGSGVFVRAREDLRFLHHSFSEFLAARRKSEEISPDFPDLDAWIARGLRPATQAFVLFTFVLWARRDSHDLGKVFRRLLDGDINRVLLAGRLLAEHTPADNDLVGSTVNRLVELILCAGTQDANWEMARRAGKVLTLLGSDVVGAAVIERLVRLRDQPEVAAATRVECALVLGHFSDPVEAAEWLEQRATTDELSSLEHIVDGMIDFLPDGADRAERLLVRLGGNAGDDYVVTLTVAAGLLSIGRSGAAAPLVRDLAARLRRDSGASDSPVMPTRATHHAGPVRILQSLNEKAAPNWAMVADIAARSGCTDEAYWAAWKVFEKAEPEEEEIGDATEVLLSVRGIAVVDEISAKARSRPADLLTVVASKLAEVHFPEAAAGLIRLLLTEKATDEDEFVRAIGILGTCSSVSDEEIRDLLATRQGLTGEQWADLTSELNDGGRRAEACRCAKQVLADLSSDNYAFWRAGETLIIAEDDEVAEEILQATLERSPAHWAEIAPLLCKAGYREAAAMLVSQILEASVASGQLVTMASDFLRFGEWSLAGDLLGAALQRTSERTYEPGLVTALFDVGSAEQAIDVARRAFVHRVSTGEFPTRFLSAWLHVGGAQAAEDIAIEILAADMHTSRRLEVARELADGGWLASATPVWLDVVRYHGEVVQDGVTAASCLVKCGQRDLVVATLTKALSEDELAPADRTRLRALLAWTTLISPAATVADLSGELEPG